MDSINLVDHVLLLGQFSILYGGKRIQIFWSWKCTICVFDGLISNQLAENQLDTNSATLLNWSERVSSPNPWKIKLVSSAKSCITGETLKWICKFKDIWIKERSFMYRANKTGPNIEPWGTPVLTIDNSSLLVYHKSVFQHIEYGTSNRTQTNSMIFL